MVSLLIIIPLLVILSLGLQFYSIFGNNFATKDGVKVGLDSCNGLCKDQCSEETPDTCIVAKTFAWLSIVPELIIFIMLLMVLFALVDFDLGYKKKGKMFVSSVSAMSFMRYYNSLLVLLPLALVFQIISFSTQVSMVDSEDFSAGFVTEVSSIIVLVLSIVMHPVFSRST